MERSINILENPHFDTNCV